jgi:hypothetical protein
MEAVKYYWTDKNRIPKSDPTSVLDYALARYEWFFLLVCFAGAGWVFLLTVSHILFLSIAAIPGQQLKRLIK